MWLTVTKLVMTPHDPHQDVAYCHKDCDDPHQDVAYCHKACDDPHMIHIRISKN
ncbi:hypothetical protein ACJMK2_009290, partial [Sinanodonta woodiana]